jgi:ubiquinone/menaquinone biosynthesis C-methylase UbiE
MAFVELVATSRRARVADVGCGPGRVAAYPAANGLDVIGFDVSPAMLAEARRAHPDIEFEEGRLDDIPITAGTLTGAVRWYSIIYTLPERLHDALAELRRVLEPGGHLFWRSKPAMVAQRTSPTCMEPGLRSPSTVTDSGVSLAAWRGPGSSCTRRPSARRA